MKKKILSFILTAAVFAVMEVFPVLAETREPANPVHHHIDTSKHDRTDATDWSYVYFGSYPQTEVAEADLSSDITEASYNENGDAWVNGTKYRRISKNDTLNHGQNWGDNREYRYFKWERIKWRVMQNNDSNLLLVSDKALDNKEYNKLGENDFAYTPVTWETCTLRQWLNSSFYSGAFSAREQEAIVEQTLTNEDHENGTEGGNDTRDKVYLLSLREATNPQYGFCQEYSDKYTRSREMAASDYAYFIGAWVSDNIEYTGTDYWLRSPGNSESRAAHVSYVGYILQDLQATEDEGVVPALTISKSSNLWYTEDDGTSGDGGDKEGTDNPPGEVTVSCNNAMEMEAGQEKELSLNIRGNTESQLDGWKNEAEITVSDTSVITVEKGNFTNANLSTEGAAEAAWILKVKGVKPGTAAINIKYQGNVAASCNVTVLSKDQTNPPDTEQTVTPPETPKIKVKKLSISAISNKIAAGKKVALKVTVSPKNATNPKVTWKTDNKKYATVDSKGIVTTKKAGKGKTVKITATAKDGSGKKASIKLKLMKNAVTKVRIKKANTTLKAGKSIKLKAEVWINGKDANNKLQWTVSNDKYATVNSNGKVTAKKAGKGKTVTVTAMSTDGTNKKAKVKIKIK